MNPIPARDGYHWVNIISHTMSNIRIKNKYQIVKLSSNKNHMDKITRYIEFLETTYGRSNRCRIQYFAQRVVFEDFIPIEHPLGLDLNE